MLCGHRWASAFNRKRIRNMVRGHNPLGSETVSTQALQPPERVLRLLLPYFLARLRRRKSGVYLQRIPDPPVTTPTARDGSESHCRLGEPPAKLWTFPLCVGNSSQNHSAMIPLGRQPKGSITSKCPSSLYNVADADCESPPRAE